MTGLKAHLELGVTTLCRCWRIRRSDGVTMGFTDHDLDLEFDGVIHRAGTGLGAKALAQTTGLSVDNSEAIGALSDGALREADLRAGRYDGAAVEIWRVNWARPDERALQFRGQIGEVSHGAGAFRAELRGLTETLNQPLGRVYQRPCAAVLGDRHCRMDLGQPGYHHEIRVEALTGGRVFRFTELVDFADRWFERGRLLVLEGQAAGLSGVIKMDRLEVEGRQIELWLPMPADLRTGELVRLEAGCDRRADTCRDKFNNFINFRGFPHLPSEDWLMAVPRSGGQ